MVLYELFLTMKHTTPFPKLSSVMKKISLEVVSDGGVVRSVQNHGIRDLPHRVQANRPDLFGNRLFEKGRLVSVYFDGNPNTHKLIENVLIFEDEVLRRHFIKARNPLWFVNIAREDHNPYLKKLHKMDHQERMKQQQLAKQQRLAAKAAAAAEAGTNMETAGAESAVFATDSMETEMTAMTNDVEQIFMQEEHTETGAMATEEQQVVEAMATNDSTIPEPPVSEAETTPR